MTPISESIAKEYPKESNLHPVTQVFPEALRNILFQFVFEGALESLIKDHKGTPLKSPERATGYDMRGAFTTEDIAAAVSSNPKSTELFRGFLEFVQDQEASAKRKLAALDFADATLITDLI